MTKMGKAYHRKYNLVRCRRLKREYEALLGGRCRCGAVTELEFDHIDPKTKLFQIGSNITKPRSIILAELAKCQLLCKPCHIEKSITDSGKLKARGTHGTLSSHRYCKCRECKAVKLQYMRERRNRIRQQADLAQWK